MNQDVFTQAGNRTTLLHGDCVVICQQTGQLEIHRPKDRNPPPFGEGTYESLKFEGAVALTPDAGEAELLGIVSALAGSERLKLDPSETLLPDRFRVWTLVARRDQRIW